MERRLPQPLDAEILDDEGKWTQVTLYVYLGNDCWRGTRADGREMTVTAGQILSLARRATA